MHELRQHNQQRRAAVHAITAAKQRIAALVLILKDLETTLDSPYVNHIAMNHRVPHDIGLLITQLHGRKTAIEVLTASDTPPQSLDQP